MKEVSIVTATVASSAGNSTSMNTYLDRVRNDDATDDDGYELPDDNDQVEKLYSTLIIPWWVGADTGCCGWKVSFISWISIFKSTRLLGLN
jgi:hypothetical protein